MTREAASFPNGMDAAFRNSFERHRYSCPAEGMAAWLSLSGHCDRVSLEKETARKGLRIYSAEKLAMDSKVPPNDIRIALPGPEDLPPFTKA